ncbi:MAG: response regulator [Mariprofundales bacterium]
MSNVIKVLIVEDEAMIQGILRSFTTKFAKNLGVEVEIVSYDDPVKGLFELSSNGAAYAAILLDVRLPKLTGDEIYSSLELVNPELKAKVMFVTGYPDDLADRFPDAKLIVLQKPFRYQAFAEKISEVLRR